MLTLSVVISVVPFAPLLEAAVTFLVTRDDTRAKYTISNCLPDACAQSRYLRVIWGAYLKYGFLISTSRNYNFVGLGEGPESVPTKCFPK